MTGFDEMIARCRRSLARSRVRAGAVALVFAVIVVQFGLVKHTIEAGPQHADVACEFCVAGDHHSPLAASVAHVVPIPTAAPPRALHPVVTPAAPERAAHRVRGPPRNV